MAPIAWPADLRPSTASFWLEANTAKNESPLSRATQVLVRQGARWRCDMTFDHRNKATSARLDALLAMVDGSGTEIYLFDFRRPVPRGDARLLNAPILTSFLDGTHFAGNTYFVDSYVPAFPYVMTACTKGSELIAVKGFGALRQTFLAGDYIGINGYLYMVVADASSDLAGAANLQIRPRLRADIAVGNAVAVVNPSCRFRLADNAQGTNRTEAGLFSSYTISFMESLP